MKSSRLYEDNRILSKMCDKIECETLDNETVISREGPLASLSFSVKGLWAFSENRITLNSK